MFEDLETESEPLELVQLVKFVTWSRLVGVVLRESIINHVYVKDPTIISDMKSLTLVFGDHKLIIFCIDVIKPKIEVTYKRNWRHYS